MKNAARTVALGRAAFSVAYLAIPSKINRSWLGETRPVASSNLLARSVAARDLSLSIGALIALEHSDARPELWFAAHAAADLTDFGSTFALREALPNGGVGSATSAGISAVAAATVAVLLATRRA